MIHDLTNLWKRLPVRVRREIETLEAAMQSIQASRCVTKSARAMAGTPAAMLLSEARLRSLFYRWQRHGIAALVNHNKCGGCGLPGCGRPRELSIPSALIEEWRHRAGANDKRAFRQAWRSIIEDLTDGRALPGVGSWMELWAECHPHRDIPEKCPWSLHNPPPGWSRRNFQLNRQPEAQYLLQKKGGSAAAAHLPEVRIDMAALRPLEYVVFDDHRLDFYVLAPDTRGRVQVVELWGLFAMDVATRCVIAFGLRPRLAREDGTTEAFTRRDMQHLVAGMLAKCGYPRAFPMTLIVENAAAALSTESEQLLARVSGGQIKVRRTGVHCGDLRLAGFPERWGNPRGKAVLESWFHPLDITLGAVKGQTGSNYLVKPGETEARLSSAQKLARITAALPEQERERLSHPFEHSADALELVHAAVRALNSRTDHEMRCFNPIREWRWGASDPHWKPLLLSAAGAEDRPAVAEFLAQPESVRHAILRTNSRERMESPMERWDRLWQPGDYHTVTPAVFADLYLDAVKAEYRGGDVIDLDIKRTARRTLTVRYRGHEHDLQPGARVICRIDSDRPEAGVWFTDEAGRYLGCMQSDGQIGSLERLQKDLGARAKAQAELVRTVRQRILTPERAEEQIAEFDRNLEVLGTIATQALPPAPENAASEALVAAVQQPRTPPKRHRRRVPEPEPATRDPFSFE